MWVKIGNDTVSKSRTVELFGITIDNELKLDKQMTMFV